MSKKKQPKSGSPRKRRPPPKRRIPAIRVYPAATQAFCDQVISLHWIDPTGELAQQYMREVALELGVPYLIDNPLAPLEIDR